LRCLAVVVPGCFSLFKRKPAVKQTSRRVFIPRHPL